MPPPLLEGPDVEIGEAQEGEAQDPHMRGAA